MNKIKKSVLKISELFIHNREEYNILIKENDKFTSVSGDVMGHLILHSNIEELHIKPIGSEFSVSFSYKGKFDYIRFRITTSKSNEDYKDIILYPTISTEKVNVAIDNFNIDEVMVVDFNIYGSSVNIFLSDLEIEFVETKEKTRLLPKPIKKYIKSNLLRDCEMLMSPEPHSQERALAILDNLNMKKNVETIDLGAGGAPMMAEMLLRKGKGKVDCLVYGEDDVRKAKRYLSRYEERVNVFNGDLTNHETLPQKKYDQILLLDVLEHIEDEKLVLNNIKHLFNKESILIVTVPNVNYKEVMSIEFHNFVGHLRDGYTIDSLSKILNENGFEIIESFNFSQSNKEFYRLWYGELKAWSGAYQYSELAYDFVQSKFKPLKEKLKGENGISNCIICRLKC
ncbi:MAG: class I SAM-dependent methyltransferase [Clostridium beijerinckii]|jgi:2-polyprenyl-3-methyl-5-hydroxy-6-metoxy-1,4-benzoquinol methylase|nr:class I SAM-dependent methyltransferase [Clostridium beijerinckii]MCI1577500.1 class I SAM-dependent methyltransferase [Clostridium beijerinckii]MCI1583273.1 class I SAM-dependent methyltransferase [Clostridium beijerinckii]MCI1621173.1 class I SAM-dependent methyltransferase [Clostridium beijerinckii]